MAVLPEMASRLRVLGTPAERVDEMGSTRRELTAWVKDAEAPPEGQAVDWHDLQSIGRRERWARRGGVPPIIGAAVVAVLYVIQVWAQPSLGSATTQPSRFGTPRSGRSRGWRSQHCCR
jgi:hypothetical protein